MNTIPSSLSKEEIELATNLMNDNPFNPEHSWAEGRVADIITGMRYAQQLQPPGTSDAVEQDEFVEKHLERVKLKMKESVIHSLIEKHLSWHPTNLEMASAKYFAESGKVSGNLRLAIEKIAVGYAEYVVRTNMFPKSLLNSDPNAPVSDTTASHSSHVADNQNNQENREKL